MILKYLHRVGYSMSGVFNDIEISAQDRISRDWSV
jgi:hypothetical protein